jgi:hypothetical protein
MTIAMPQQPLRSKHEIEGELRALHALLNNVPPKTVFGDDNRQAIRAQIRVLEERMDFEAVADEFEDKGDYILSNATDALRWLEDHDEPVSMSWLVLVEG